MMTMLYPLYMNLPVNLYIGNRTKSVVASEKVDCGLVLVENGLLMISIIISSDQRQNVEEKEDTILIPFTTRNVRNSRYQKYIAFVLNQLHV